MANEEQLKILKSGVEEWNGWREESQVFIDLSRAKFIDADLSRADLSRADLSYANLNYASLIDANLDYSDLSNANLRGANLSGATLNSAVLYATNLTGAILRGAHLYAADLREADLNEADLRTAFLRRANLREADLSVAKLYCTDFVEADLTEADLRKVDFSETMIYKTTLATGLADIQGLENCFHLGPSTIGTETLELAQGKLPDVFLKDCGLKDWEILNARLYDPNLRPDEVIDITYEVANLRTKGPIQVNTLFISYARVDSEFVEFLEKRLDDDGIRSWRDVHDMVAGPIQPQIDRAIDLNGTVLLVLSEDSLGSDWVEWEVQKARGLQKKREAEGKRDAHVLCPVAIDDTWKDSRWSGPLMNQLLRYNILDFSDWEDQEAVEKVYAKLRAGIAKYYSGESGVDD